MTRQLFERELQHLQDQILQLGSEVEENLVRAVEALKGRNRLVSRQLILADEWINERRVRIGMDGLALIATQQPAAGDMRLIAAVLEIAGELERIHDYAKGIAKINLMIGEDEVPHSLVHLMPQMAENTCQMLRRALDAFSQRDAELARRIPEADDVVDALYYQSYRKIINYVMENPLAIEHANRLEWAAHNLERSADRVTNICEWVVYMVTGKYTELDKEVAAAQPVN